MKYTVGLTDKKASSRKPLKRRNSRISTKPHVSQGRKKTVSKRVSDHKIRYSSLSSSERAKAKKNFTSKTLKGLSSKFKWGGKKSSKGGRKRPTTSKNLSRKQKIKKIFAKIFIYSAATVFFGGIILFFALGLYLKGLQDSLPDPERLTTWNPDQSTVILDRNGTELFKFYGDENREFVSIDDIPDHTKWALLAAEDVEFYQHKGIDIKGIVSCAVKGANSYIKSGSSGDFCGASTISQQLVRNTIMSEVYGADAYTREFQGAGLLKTVQRKIREWLLTMQVEKVFTKDEILQMYMNEVPLGGVNYGYQAASNAYFNKDVQDLTIAESAYLAGIIQAPSAYSPLDGVGNDAGLARKDYVLNQIEKYQDLTGITDDELSTARSQELVFESPKINIQAYHFVFYVKDYLIKQFGADAVEKGGLRVTTTLDLPTQKIAEEELKNGLKKWGSMRNAHNGAMVVLDPKTNQILSMVGSVDPFSNDPRINGSFNVTTAERQVGSSFKPYVYLTMFQKYGPWLETADIPYSFGGYKPVDWDHKFMGPMNARLALVKSRNLPANYTMQLMGIENVLSNVEKMGITTLKDKANYGLALALGAGEMKLLEHAQGFSVFATGGIKRDVTPILKVEDSNGNVLSKYEDTGKRIFDEKDIYMVNWAICDLGGFGDQAGARYYNINGRRAICGKTGTTNGPKDLLSIQYHKNLVVAVWTGNNNNEDMGPNAWSTNIPLPIANSFMNRVVDKYPSELFTRPAGILATTVCSDTGKIPQKGVDCPTVSSIYVKGHGPGQDSREAVTICKDSGLVSTNKDIADSLGLTLTKYVLNYNLENAIQQKSYEKYIKEKMGNTNLLTEMPESGDCTLPLGPDNAPIIQITSPSDRSTVTAGDNLNITVNTQALESVDHVNYYFNGSSIGTSSAAPYGITYTIPSSTPSGNYTLSATVFDNLGKTGSYSINIKVDGVIAPTNTVSLTAPTGGATLSMPFTFQATVNGFTANSVTFTITGPGGYLKSLADTNAGDGWSVNWNDAGAVAGAYKVTATAVSGSGGSAIIVSSSPVNFSL